MKKKAIDVIRVGDRVEVVENKFIIRVGYPVIWKDLYWEVAESKELNQASDILGVDLDNFKIVKEIAHLKASQMNFGGNERRIIYYPSPADVQQKIDSESIDGMCIWLNSIPPREEDYIASGPYIMNIGLRSASKSLIGETFTVIKKRIAKTGMRFTDLHGYDAYNGDYWDEPGGLADQKTHIILELSNGFEIEQIHVKKIQ